MSSHREKESEQMELLLGCINEKLQQKLKKSEETKFELLGKISENLAHDIRNPLYAIRNSMTLIQKHPTKETISREIQRIDRCSKRILHQIDDVLEYVSTTPLVITSESILELIKISLDYVGIPSNIHVKFPEKDVVIDCDKNKSQIVFINIILNAVQAIEDNDGIIQINIHPSSDYVMIEFSNSGPPISKVIVSKIFVPMYTTKMQGVGLGLTTCKNIITQHKGDIFVSGDSTFTIKLPLKFTTM